MLLKNIFHLIKLYSIFFLIVSCSDSNENQQDFDKSLVSRGQLTQYPSPTLKDDTDVIAGSEITISNKDNVYSSSSSRKTLTRTPLYTMEGVREVTEKSDFTISNTDIIHSRSDNIYSSPDKNTISWTAPTKRESGTEIIQSELKKYIIFYGTRSKTYTSHIVIDNKFNNALPTSVSIDHLEPGVVYYFSGISVDSNGLRSIMSNEISRLIEP